MNNNLDNILTKDAVECNNIYVEQPPIYLSVSKNDFNNMGIGDPLNPYNYPAIISKVTGSYNNVKPTCAKDLITTVFKPTTLIVSCDENLNSEIKQEIPALVELNQLRVLASCLYNPILTSTGIGIFAVSQEFVGLDQIIGYYGPNDTIPSLDNFNIHLKFKDGNPNDPDNPGGTGFDGILFRPDDENYPNGPGTYFFRIIVSARIDIK